MKACTAFNRGDGWIGGAHDASRVFSAAATVKKSRMARDARIACAETLYLQTDRDKQVNKSVRRVRRIWILALIYLSAPPWCPIDHDETRHQHVCGALQTARQEKYERCLGGGNTGRECTISFLMSKTF